MKILHINILRHVLLIDRSNEIKFISFQQPTWRLWGEEREKDAIFTVYLKKVRYHRPTPSASSVSNMYNFNFTFQIKLYYSRVFSGADILYTYILRYII